MEGCHPPTSFRPLERQKQDWTVDIGWSQPASQRLPVSKNRPPGGYLCWGADYGAGARVGRASSFADGAGRQLDGGIGNRLWCSEN